MKKTITSLMYIFTFIFLINLSCLKAQMYWNQASSFAGTQTSYASVPNSSSVNITGSFSIEAWVNPSNTANKGVIAKGGSLGTSLRYAIRITSSRVVLITNGGPRLSSKSTSLIPVNTWTHISATYNSGSGNFNIYINGILDSSSVVAGAAPTANTDSLYIGISGASTPFNGMLDEVRLWNRELTAAEVNNNMSTSLQTSSGIYSGLVLSMTFQNPVNSSPFSFNDQSGNGNNGNGRNVTQFDQSFRPLHTISQNECLKFNGNNDYLAGKDTPALSPSPNITVECWVYPQLDQPMTILKKGNSYEVFYTGSRINAKLNGVNFSISGVSAPLNTWTNFMFSYNSSTGIITYGINGNAFGSFASSVSIPVNTDSLLIGGGITESDFVGYIDEVRISNKAVSREVYKSTIFTSLDVNNDPNISAVKVNYSFDGNTFDNVNNGGPELFFRNNASFSHPGQSEDVPVSPLNRNANESFQKGFYMRRPFAAIPSFGIVSDSVKINYGDPLTDINLFISLNHQNLNDLIIYLIAPNGDSVRVFNNNSPGSLDNNLVTIFDDNADSSLINNRYNSFYTKIKPVDNLGSVFNGDNPGGMWKLHINDTESGNTGVLYSWGIQINNQTKRDFNMNLKAILQGFYDPNTNLMIPDTVIVNIRNKFSPYNIVETHKEILDSTGVGRFSLLGTGNVDVDSLYTVQVIHRNSIESWINL
ncbi:MAG: proprotein convertase P-domain-containing protein [Ignavibacteria bacterium]|nr:proprotein convertase P-domain-containing protein [Ignavibacteria bacterium]